MQIPKQPRKWLLAAAPLVLIVLFLGGRLAMATYNARRFVDALRAEDTAAINALYRPPHGLAFSVCFPLMDAETAGRLRPVSFSDLLQGRRRMTLHPASQLSAWPLYVDVKGVYEYEKYVL